jgi:thymidine kinase
MRGGVTFFRSGGGAAARAYLEQDHARADDYYLADGAGLADRVVVAGDGQVLVTGVLDGDGYEAWADWRDPVTGEAHGTPRERKIVDPVTGVVVGSASSPRFVEMTVNSDKTLSIAAALNPAVSEALDAAQRDAAAEMTGYMARHSRTRVGPLGRQWLVPVERLEAAVISHRTSRAGDPHRHLHVQWNARVFAEGKWRGLDTATTLRQQGALRGIGESVINSHPALRTALAEAGFTFDPATGKVTELDPYVAGMSKRAAQVDTNRGVLEVEWRDAHPGVTPGPKIVRSWDRQAWDKDRPEKKPSVLSNEARWIGELVDAGYTPPARQVPVVAVSIGSLDRNQIAMDVVQQVSARRSAWSIADLHDAAGHLVAETGITADKGILGELLEDLTARAVQHSTALTEPTHGQVMPEAVRHLTSTHVVLVEKDVADRLATRAAHLGTDAQLPEVVTAGGRELGAQQRAVVQAMAGTHQLIVIEGAAGAGKTTALLAAKTLLEQQGRTQVVVAPTLKAAKEAAQATGSQASSIHKLLHQHGWRWDDTGRWSRLTVGDVDPKTGAEFTGPSPDYVLSPSTQVVVDEAGMIDQDTARALLITADNAGAPLVLMGDRAQLSAVGRGGVLDKAVLLTSSHVDVDEVHRFTDPAYATLTVRMRDREEPGVIFDELLARGQVQIHTTEAQAFQAMSAEALADTAAGRTVAMSVATNETATALNSAVRDARLTAGLVSEGRTTTGADGVLIGQGDLVMTRRNDTDLGVANRDLYTVAAVHRDGGLVVVGSDRRRRTLTPEYVVEKVHLGYATTAHGNQGTTVDTAHTLLSPGVDAAGVYVPMTRGRDTNTLHVVAIDQKDARQQFIEAMTRESGDRGLDAAKEALATQIRGLDLTDDTRSPTVRLIDDLKTRTADLAPAEAVFREKWMGVLDQRVHELNRREQVVQGAEQRKQRAEDWVASGKTTPMQARAAVSDAVTERDAAQKALDAVRRDHQHHLADVQSGTSRELWQEITRARLAEEAVARANVFQKLSARNTFREVKADVEQKIGSPLPQAENRGDWVENRARDAMKGAQTEAAPVVDAATARVAAAERVLTERQDTEKRVSAEWAQIIDRRKDPTAALSPELQRAQRASQTAAPGRPATTKPQDPLDRYVTLEQRESFAVRDLPQARERVENTSRYIDRFDQATPEQRMGMIERAATRAAEQAKTAEAKVLEARQQAERTRRSYTPPPLGNRDRGHDLER